MNYTITKQTNELLFNNKFILGCNKANTPDKSFYVYQGFDDAGVLNDELKRGLPLYELIREGSIVKPYIDYDDTDPERNRINNMKDFIFLSEVGKKEILKRLVNIFVLACVNLGCNLNIDDVLIIDGSRKIVIDNKTIYKYSFHITTINNRFVFKNTSQCKINLIPSLENAEKELYNNLTIFKNIDVSVYGKTQRLRTVYSPKSNFDLVVLTPINRDAEEINLYEPINYLVQYFNDDYVFINCLEISKTEPVKHITIDKVKQENIINNYSKDILKILVNKGMATATIQQVTNKNNYNTYHILYNPIINTCIYGQAHTRPARGICVCYAYVLNGNVYAGCWGNICKSNQHINIGSVLEVSPMEDVNNAFQVNEKYLTENKKNKVNEYMNDFVNNPNLKILCIKSGTGTGKTYLLNQYIKQGARVLLISTRQSYARSICGQSLKELNIINYLDYKEDKTTDNNDIYKLNRLCISMEGLNGLMLDRWKPYEYVIIDESESVCRHLFSHTIKSGSYGTFERLRLLIEKSTKTFLLDADLSNPSLALINNYNHSQILKINNTYDSNNKTYYFTKDKKEFINDIKTHIILNRKLYIVCLSKTEANELYDVLKPTFNNNNKRCLLLHGDIGDIEKRNLNNVNMNWINEDVIITTSTTGAGVDFNIKNHFDFVYGFITAGCSPPVEFMQIIDRVRNPINKLVTVLIDGKIQIPNENTFLCTLNNSKFIIDELNKNTVLSDLVNRTYEDVEGFINNEIIYVEKNNDYSKLTYYNYLTNTLNNTNNNYLLVLKLLLLQKGHKCIIDLEKYKQKKAKNNEAEHLKQHKIISYTNNEIENIYKKQIKTTSEKEIMKKIKICNTFEIHKTKRDDEQTNIILDTMSKPANKDAISLILKSHITDEHNEELINFNKEYSDETDKIRQNKFNLYRRLLTLIKYDYTADFKISVEEMLKIETEYIITDVERRCITRTKINGYMFIHSLLNKYGLILNKNWLTKRTGKARTNIINGYTITQDKNIYGCVNLLIKNNNKYDERLKGLCNIYNQFNDLQIGEPLKIQKLF